MSNENFGPELPKQQPEKERTFSFVKLDPVTKQPLPGAEPEFIPESELTPDHCHALAQMFWDNFIMMPALAQDMLVRRIINESINPSNEQIVENAVKSNIILPPNFGN